jgi:hypothetical protein
MMTLFLLRTIRQPVLPPLNGFPVSAFILFVIQAEAGDGARFVVVIQRHKCQIGCSGMPDGSGDEIFCFNPNAPTSMEVFPTRLRLAFNVNKFPINTGL